MATHPDRHAGHNLYGLASTEAVARIEQLLTAQPSGLRVEQGDLIQAFDSAAREHVNRLHMAGEQPRGARRGIGAFYTPPNLAEELMDAALARLIPTRSGLLRCLDPAVGTGVFLVAYVRRAFHNLHRRSGDKSSLLHSLLCEGVHGVDIDPMAVRLARAAVLIAGRELASSHSIEFRGADVSAALRGHIIVADSLAAGPQLTTYPLSPDTPYDLIASNPPFVSLSGRESARDGSGAWSRLQAKYRIARGWPGLAPLFLELAHSLLSEGGVMAMVLPGALLHQSSYTPAREFLASGFVQLDADLLPEDVFADVSSTVATILCTKGAPAQPATGAPLITAAPNSFWRRVNASPEFIPLADIAQVRDFGIHTGNVRAKVLTESQTPRHVPVLRGRDLTAFSIGPAKRFCDLAPDLAQGEYMRTRPALAYEREKILIRQTASRPICAVDREGRYFLNSLLVIYPACDSDALCALLNSDCVCDYYRASFPEARQRAFPQVKKAYLDALPVPTALLDPDASCVWELGLLGRQLAGGEEVSDRALARLNELVWPLYGAGV